VGRAEEAHPAEISPSGAARALVTRPQEEAVSLAAALARRGIDAVIEPMIEVHFRTTAAPDLTDVQAILCTSANGVRALARLIVERDRPLLAVGDATALRARAEGFTNVASAGGSIVDLVLLAGARLCPESGRLLHVAGEVVAGDLAGALRKQGFTTERIVLYDAQPVAALSPSTMRALRRGEIDFALFFSPRTATIFVGLATCAGLAEFCPMITTVSISRAADAALSALPWRDRRVAQKPTQAALLDQLDRLLGERQRVAS
jgi:uroporphyrinogen-III synthase